MSRTDQARPAAPMTTADLEAAIAALPGRKQRLRESFDRLVACAPLHVHLPFTWDDIDAHVSSLHASFSLRFRQMQQQPHPGVSVSATATHDDEQPHPGVSVPAAHDHEQPHPGVPVSAAHDDESIEEDVEMVREDEDASPVQDDDKVEKDREDAGMGAPCRQAGGTRDQEFAVPIRVHAPHAGNPMLRQPYMVFPPDVLCQLNLPMPKRQQPYMAYRQEFPAMAYNIPPMVQQPYVPYFRQEFFPDMMRQAPMGIDHVLQQQYMAMAHHQPYFPQQQHMAYHQHHFTVAQAASAQGQGSNAKRGRPSRTTNTDNINVLINEPSKKSRTIRKHDAKPKANDEPIQKKTIYDYF